MNLSYLYRGCSLLCGYNGRQALVVSENSGGIEIGNIFPFPVLGILSHFYKKSSKKNSKWRSNNL